MNWKIGQKLVCVRDAVGKNKHLCPVRKDEIYTFAGWDIDLGFPYITLYEFPSPFGFNKSGFREVIDISFGEWVEETVMKEVIYEEALTEV